MLCKALFYNSLILLLTLYYVKLYFLHSLYYFRNSPMKENLAESCIYISGKTRVVVLFFEYLPFSLLSLIFHSKILKKGLLLPLYRWWNWRFQLENVTKWGNTIRNKLLDITYGYKCMMPKHRSLPLHQ